jgi:hypothetical protein
VAICEYGPDAAGKQYRSRFRVVGRIWRGKDSPETTVTTAEANTTENTAAVAEQGATVVPGKASSKKVATQKKGAPKGQKTAKGGKTKVSAPKKEAKAGKKAAKRASAKEASTPRAESKGAKILALIGRPKGASGGGPAERNAERYPQYQSPGALKHPDAPPRRFGTMPDVSWRGPGGIDRRQTPRHDPRTLHFFRH